MYVYCQTLNGEREAISILLHTREDLGLNLGPVIIYIDRVFKWIP